MRRLLTALTLTLLLVTGLAIPTTLGAPAPEPTPASDPCSLCDALRARYPWTA